MFTKREKRIQIDGYKDVIDWSAIGGALIIAIFVLAIIGNLAN